jgi:ectoine hydroxylase-related dioxygenase (phytanoyl-CoA dioxygenase family)
MSSSSSSSSSSSTETKLSLSSLITKEQLTEFHEQGYTLLQNVFTSAEVEEIELACNRVRERAHQIVTNPNNYTLIRQTIMNSSPGVHIIIPGHDGSRFTFQTHPLYPKDTWTNDTVPSLENLSLRHIAWVGKEETVLEKYGRHPKIIGLATAFLDFAALQRDHYSSITMIINQAHYKEPNDGVAFPYHQDSQHRRMHQGDFVDTNGKGSYCQLILALDDTTIDSGPISFIKYSNKLGNISNSNGLDTDQINHANKVTPLLKRGEIVAFGPYTIHGSEPNTSSHWRKTFINGFAYPSAQRAKDRIHCEEISIEGFTE